MWKEVGKGMVRWEILLMREEEGGRDHLWEEEEHHEGNIKSEIATWIGWKWKADITTKVTKLRESFCESKVNWCFSQ